MKTFNLETYRSAWKNESGFENRKLSEKEIQQFLKSKSKKIEYVFKTGIIMNLIYKFLLSVAFIVFLYVFRPNHLWFSIPLVLVSVCILAMAYLLHVYYRIPNKFKPELDLKSNLSIYIRYYHKVFKKAIFVSAVSNPLFLIAGSLYYFYFKYGEIRPFALDDYLVFSAFIVISYALGAIVQLAQYNFQIGQMEDSLKEIDEETITKLNLKLRKKKRIRVLIIVSLAVVLGVLVFIYLLSS